MAVSADRTKEAKELVDQYGVDVAASKLGVGRETVRRYVREAKEEIGNQVECDESLMKKIAARYTSDELRCIANGRGISLNQQNRPVLNFEGEEVCIGFATDLHIGSKFFEDSLWLSFVNECKREGVQQIFLGGDICEGMSNRPDQMYSLTDLGFSNQMDHAERLFRMTDIDIQTIDGNHDRWGIKSGGVFAVRDIANRMPGHVTFLGHDCGDIVINDSIWRLWHGEDGSSYATSYRIQKIIESFTGGDKPSVLLCGHTHKQAYIFERNIHAVSGGALSCQSDWMRSKRLANHTGFHIIHAKIKDGQIVRFSPTWYPFYF